MQNIRISVYTHDEATDGLSKLLAPAAEYSFYTNYDDLISGLPNDKCEAVMIARNGAEGMESARAVKILCPSIPIFWFSDDSGFGAESFRIGCAYFTSAPITKEAINTALERLN